MLRGAHTGRTGHLLGISCPPRRGAVWTEGNDQLLPLISQLMRPALQNALVLAKHGSGLRTFGLLGRAVEPKHPHVLPMHAFLWGAGGYGVDSPTCGARGATNAALSRGRDPF